MPCCCTRVLNLCKVPVCGTLELPIDSGGEYSLVLDFLNIQITLPMEDGVFDVSKLNENFEYTGQVKDVNGEVVIFTVDAVEYDCIRFKTILNVLV